MLTIQILRDNTWHNLTTIEKSTYNEPDAKTMARAEFQRDRWLTNYFFPRNENVVMRIV